MKILLDSASRHIPKVIWVVLLLTVLIIIVKQLPASWSARFISSQTACRVTLYQPLGTIWQGSAALGFSESNLVGGGCREPSALTERFHWTTQCNVSNGECGLALSFSALDQPLLILLKLGQVTVTSGEISLPATILEGVGNPWSTLRPRGQLSARWTELKIGKETTGTIRLMMSSLSSPISPVKPLGSYEMQVNLAQTGTVFNLSTTMGPLLLSGKGNMGTGTSPGLHFLGAATASAEAQESLIGLLSLLGKKDGEIYRMQY
jgi:general secretion pathway protein N